MKRTQKILSLLLAIVMVFVMAPIVTAVDANVTLGTASVTCYNSDSGNYVTSYLQIGAASSYRSEFQFYDSIVIAAGESGSWTRQPSNTLVGYGTVYPTDFAIGNVSVSAEGVIGDIKASLIKQSGAPAFVLEYSVLTEDEVTLTADLYYNYGLKNVSGGTIWHRDTVTLTINDPDYDPDANKPDKPTVSDIERFCNYINSSSSSKGAVYMWCDTYDHHGWFDYITDVDDAYTLGDVVANDGSALSKTTYPWICVMTVDANKYLDVYNESELGYAYGTHYLADGQSQTEVATWYWNANLNKWQFRGVEAPIYIDITHAAPVVEYTVIYTDGVNGTAFADQTYTVESGDATPAFVGTPARDGYVFLGWEPEVAETVTGNATYTAVWEEVLTDVTVKSSIKADKLLFLHDTFTVTATANTSANIDIAVENAAITPTAVKVSEDGKSVTVTYEVVKITGPYVKFNFTATATKGTQPAVNGTLSYYVNLRNRIHFVLKDTNGNFKDNAENVKLIHQYSKWNKCPSLKVSGNEYVMANAWDFCNEPYISLDFDYNGVHYSTNVDAFGRDLKSVITAGTEEIYVEYTVVTPIKVTITVNGENVGEQNFNGSKDDVLDYSDMLNSVISGLITGGKTITNLSTEYLDKNGAAVSDSIFGTAESVVITITTK